jgi:hypothetical protein
MNATGIHTKSQVLDNRYFHIGILEYNKPTDGDFETALNLHHIGKVEVPLHQINPEPNSRSQSIHDSRFPLFLLYLVRIGQC